MRLTFKFEVNQKPYEKEFNFSTQEEVELKCEEIKEKFEKAGYKFGRQIMIYPDTDKYFFNYDWFTTSAGKRYYPNLRVFGQKHKLLNDDISKYFHNMVFWCNSQKKIKLDSLYVRGIIALWGRTMYLNYDSLPEYINLNLLTRIRGDFMQLLGLIKIKDDSAIFEELIDWFDEGASMYKEKHLGQNGIDQAFLNNMKFVTSPMTIYRTCDWDENDENYKGWVSVTTLKGNYGIGNKMEEKKFVLPVGFPIVSTVINGEKLCDNGEFIVRFEDLMQLENYKSKMYPIIYEDFQ